MYFIDYLHITCTITYYVISKFVAKDYKVLWGSNCPRGVLIVYSSRIFFLFK